MAMTFGSNSRYIYLLDIVVYLCTMFLLSLKVAMYSHAP